MEIPLSLQGSHHSIANLEDEMCAEVMWEIIEKHCPPNQRQYGREMAEGRVRAVGEGLVSLHKQQQ